MSLSKMIAASAVGAVMLSSGAHASGGRSLAKTVNVSKVSCSAIATGYSKVSNDQAIAHVTADAAAYICNGETDKSAHSIAEATASAYAEALAFASVQCSIEGDAEAHGTASAKAEAAAHVWIKAYAEAFASAGDCDKCEAWAESYGYVEKEVFLKAVASAEAKLDVVSSGGQQAFIAVFDYQEAVKEVVVTAFAEAIAGAAKWKDENSCSAWVNTGGCLYHPDHPDTVAPNCFECTAYAVSASDIEEIDAVADAAAQAAAWTCGETVSYSELLLTAQALAKATAYACSISFASCEVDGGWSCSYAGTSIEETARAVATAYAGIWAGAYSCDDSCQAGVDQVATAVGDVLVEVATTAYAEACVDGQESWTVDDFSVRIEEANMCALASAHAYAMATPDFCLAGGIILTEAQEGECPDL